MLCWVVSVELCDDLDGALRCAAWSLHFPACGARLLVYLEQASRPPAPFGGTARCWSCFERYLPRHGGPAGVGGCAVCSAQAGSQPHRDRSSGWMQKPILRAVRNETRSDNKSRETSAWVSHRAAAIGAGLSLVGCVGVVGFFP